MTELRNFILASAGTLGLLEASNSEALMPTDSDPETMVIKAIITLAVGALSSLLTRLFKKRQIKGKSQKSTTRRRLNKSAAKNRSLTTKSK
nr:hypothetical protein [uncultured Carboxylicivirga sp.]